MVAAACVALARATQAAEPADASLATRGASAEPTRSVAPFNAVRDPLALASSRPPAELAPHEIECRAWGVCYDGRERQVELRGGARYLPRVQGLTPEGLSLRRDRLILRYSF